MAITGISSGTTAQTSAIQNSWKQRKDAFDQLGQALQSGDLNAAQQAFATLTQNSPASGSSSAPGSSGQSGVSQALDALGQAMQSGDVKQAQQAFAAFQQAVQQAGGKGHHHHHRHAASAPSAPAAASSTTNASDTVGTNVDVVA